MPVNLPRQGPAEASLSGQLILVVEDSFHLAMHVARTLRTAGAQLLGPFSDAADAERALRGPSPSGAVLDINLDYGSSLALAQVLAERGIPFLFYTGYDEGTLPLDFAHVPHLQKPVEPSRLIESMRELLTPR